MFNSRKKRVKAKKKITREIDCSKFTIDFITKGDKVISSIYIGKDDNAVLEVWSPQYDLSSKDEIIKLIVYKQFQANKDKIKISEISKDIIANAFIKTDNAIEDIKVENCTRVRYSGVSKIPQHIIDRLYSLYMSVDKRVILWPDVPEYFKAKLLNIPEETNVKK